MSVQEDSRSTALLQRFHDAMNQGNLEAFVNCFDPDYQSEHPAHPDRAFAGADQVRKNWSNIFANVPDFRSELLRFVAEEEMIWSEWHWHGTRTNNTTMDMRGVILFGVRNERFIWGRLYMELLEEQGAGVEAAVTRISGGKP
jgi:ketosteroid isomerase-like protein